MKILQIWRYPVKSMQGETLERAQIGPDGIEGDRGWSVVDLDTGLSLTARRVPELLFAQATIPPGQPLPPRPTITLPNGNIVDGDADLSNWLGRSVELRRAQADSTGTYETTLTEDETGEWVQWSGPTGSFHDSTRTKVSLVSTKTLGAWDRRRFRINVVVDGDDEEELVGSQVRLGTVALDVLKQIDRCVVTTRPQPASPHGDALEADLSVLKTINSERDKCLGVGCVVLAAGEFALEDQLEASSG